MLFFANKTNISFSKRFSQFTYLKFGLQTKSDIFFHRDFMYANCAK